MKPMQWFSSIVVAMSLAAFGLLGCAHGSDSNAQASTAAQPAPAQQTAPAPAQKTPAQKAPATKAPAQKEQAAQPAPAKPVKGAPAPAGSKLAKVQMEMTPEQVREIMGAPTREKTYPNAKAFTPFYYGADSGVNTEWAYKGVGRVVFGTNKYTHVVRVVRIDYDPSETGQ